MILTNGNVSPTPVPIVRQVNGTFLYPNPATSGYVVVQTEDNSDNSVVRIVDIQGREVMTSMLTSSKTTLDISALGKGYYLVNIISKDGNQVQRLLIR